jgi:leucyl aminopeptidase
LRFSRASSAARASADLLVLPVLEGYSPAKAYPEVEAALDGALGRAERRGFKGRVAQSAEIDTLGRLPAERVLVVGLGAREVLDRARLNHALELGFRKSGSGLPRRLALAWLEDLSPAVTAAEMAAAAVEAAVVSSFTEATHKSARRPRKEVETLVLVAFPRVAGSVLERAVVLGEETFFARGLVNQPASELHPAAFADIARRHARAAGLAVEVVDHRALERMGYGAILAVGMGSGRPPKLVVIRHRGTAAGSAAGRRKGPLLALVGKGITFDTGGISIKPAADMGYMKGDMGGAAAVLGAMAAIARLKLDLNAVGILCMAENMVSATSMRPGDVVRSGSGKTIEVVNTDAEGRMVMADGIHHAVKLGATHVLDIATLTGGQRVALGPVAAHVQGSDEAFTGLLLEASRDSGERAWLMPSFPEYRGLIDSPIADISNSGPRDGMAISAGLFVREFAAGLPWLHVDMAAPSWNRVGAIKEMPRGPAGYGVRLLTTLAERFATKSDRFSRK